MRKTESEENHNEHTRIISLKPRILGLEDIALSTSEVNLFFDGKIVSQPDNLMFDPRSKTIYNIEYKLHDGQHQRHHAHNQLSKANVLLKRIFEDYGIVNLYVHNDYKYKRY